MSATEKNAKSGDRGHASSHVARCDQAGKGKSPANKAMKAKSSENASASVPSRSENAAKPPASMPYFVWAGAQNAAPPPPPPSAAKPPPPPVGPPPSLPSVAPSTSASSSARHSVPDPDARNSRPNRSRSPMARLEERMNRRFEQSYHDLAQSLAAQQQMMFQHFAAFQPPPT